MRKASRCRCNCPGKIRILIRQTAENGPTAFSRAVVARAFFGVAFLLLFLALAGPTQAQTESATSDSSWGYGLSHELMSPFCPGVTLAACTSPQAAELRQWILLQEAAGTSREEVIFILEERFGDAIRSTPEAEGWGLAAWLLPVVALAIGVVLVFFSLRRLVGSGSETTPDAGLRPEPQKSSVSPDDEDLARRVDQELAARNR